VLTEPGTKAASLEEAAEDPARARVDAAMPGEPDRSARCRVTTAGLCLLLAAISVMVLLAVPPAVVWLCTLVVIGGIEVVLALTRGGIHVPLAAIAALVILAQRPHGDLRPMLQVRDLSGQVS
jgi:hypothetical protein